MGLFISEKIVTARLVLQRFRYEDGAEIFYTYSSKPEATKYVAWRTHQSIGETRDFLDYVIPGWEVGRDYSFAIRLKGSGRMIGSCGMLNEEGKIQFGYILGPWHWGNGYATEATQAMLIRVKSDPQVFRIGTFVDVDNTASIKVIKKCGLIEEARLEKWFRFPNQNNEPKDCLLFKLPKMVS
jgi:[ribosomal protein S5]-alanine N-acetyltransferase